MSRLAGNIWQKTKDFGDAYLRPVGNYSIGDLGKIGLYSSGALLGSTLVNQENQNPVTAATAALGGGLGVYIGLNEGNRSIPRIVSPGYFSRGAETYSLLQQLPLNERTVLVNDVARLARNAKGFTGGLIGSGIGLGISSLLSSISEGN